MYQTKDNFKGFLIAIFCLMMLAPPYGFPYSAPDVNGDIGVFTDVSYFSFPLMYGV